MKLLTSHFAPLATWRLRRHWANTRADQAACALIAACAEFDHQVALVSDLICEVTS